MNEEDTTHAEIFSESVANELDDSIIDSLITGEPLESISMDIAVCKKGDIVVISGPINSEARVSLKNKGLDVVFIDQNSHIEKILRIEEDSTEK